MKRKDFVFGGLTTILAIGISLLIAFIIIFLVSDSPMRAIGALLSGPLQSRRLMASIFTTAIPIAFTGLAVCIMFQSAMFNMCAEAGFFLGALAAAGVASAFSFPGVLGILIPMLAGAAAGAIICFIPAFLKAKLGANELVSSLMLNYVSLFIGLFFLGNFLRDENFGALATSPIAENSRLPRILSGTGLHAGIFIAIVFVVLSYILVFKTSLGAKIRVLGQNAEFAKYTGIKVGGVVMLAQLIGGAIAGIGGSVEVMGMFTRFQWTSLPGFGWDGIILAILARNKPQHIPLAALFLSYLRVGASFMGTNTDVPTELISVIQAVMIMLITATALLRGFKQKAIIKEAISNGSV